MAFYVVRRDAGTSAARPRTVHASDNEREAMRVFYRAVKRLRQGAVELEVDGKVVHRTTAPRLRLRW